MSICLRRREFITLLGGAAVAWPLAARAQQGDRVRRIGVLDPEYKRRYSAFTQALAGLGWVDGRNVRMDLRWTDGDINRIRARAHELVGSQPDVIVTGGTTATIAVHGETRTIPIIVASGGDPVVSGIIARLNRLISAATRNNVPAVYGLSYFPRDGGFSPTEPTR
jgi:putative ABC transport system substrate-binding protein